MTETDNIKEKKYTKRRTKITISILIAIMLTMACVAVLYTMKRFSGHETWVYIPENATSDQIRDILTSTLGVSDGNRTFSMWKLQKGTPEKSHGAYLIKPGDLCLSIGRRISHGRQTPIKVTWNEARSLESAADKITAKLECTPDQFIESCNKILPHNGINKANFMTAFFPDTYEFYWNVSPDDIVEKLLKHRNRFWSSERQKKASELGLSPEQTITLASIVEEESAKRDEFGKIARLYLNRLQSDMPLQADPTVKFAYGDPTLKRITEKHISVNSPYNTYKNKGLPPGPIRFVDKRTVDAVLNAPHHGYIYMCAKEDFSGYHNFAADYPTHLANARRYRSELDRRGIR